MKKNLMSIILGVVLFAAAAIGLVGFALAIRHSSSQATSGHINHQATDEIIYYPISGAYQEVYLFSYYGIMSYVPAGTSSFVIKDSKVGNVEVYNIVYNSDDTLSCDWEKVK
jgi:hypothetical protein